MKTCPFCGEENFDSYGLKDHLVNGWCEPFNKISESDRLSSKVPELSATNFGIYLTSFLQA